MTGKIHLNFVPRGVRSDRLYIYTALRWNNKHRIIY